MLGSGELKPRPDAIAADIAPVSPPYARLSGKVAPRMPRAYQQYAMRKVNATTTMKPVERKALFNLSAKVNAPLEGLVSCSPFACEIGFSA